MKIIRVTKENLEEEHICCAISNNKDCQVEAKKRWMSRQLEEGLVFEKADVRGKAFIEYIPAEKAWCPIDAPGYMFINCLWVSGQFKGKGIMYLPFSETTVKPQFKTCAKQGIREEKGVVIYYSDQCPFTAKYVPLAEQVVRSKGITFKAIKYNSAKEAQAATVPSTSYSLFYNGKFITNEILSEKRLEKLLKEY